MADANVTQASTDIASGLSALNTVSNYLTANPPSDANVTMALASAIASFQSANQQLNQPKPAPFISSTTLILAGLLVAIGGGIWLWNAHEKKKKLTAAENPLPALRSRAAPNPRAVRGLVPAPRRRRRRKTK